jgi:hypothetical protein
MKKLKLPLVEATEEVPEGIFEAQELLMALDELISGRELEPIFIAVTSLVQTVCCEYAETLEQAQAGAESVAKAIADATVLELHWAERQAARSGS